MSRSLCFYDTNLLCVNNYRGKDYRTPETCVDCSDCIFYPENKGKRVMQSDHHRVIK